MYKIGCLITLCVTIQLIQCQFYKFEYAQKDEKDWTPPAYNPGDFPEDKVAQGEPCECVLFYQCDKDTMRIKDSGSGLVRWRNGGSDTPKKCKEIGQVCCKPPLWAEKGETEDFLKPTPGTNIESSSESVNYWNLPEEDETKETNGDGDQYQPNPNPDGNTVPSFPDPQPENQDEGTEENDEELPGLILSCGQKRVSPVDYRNTALRVSGPELETQTKFGEFPWMIMIHRTPDGIPLRLFLCGASLIHPQIVMTAAHCIAGKININEIVVRAGEYDTSTDTEPIKHQDRFVESITVHPLYNESKPRHDIALMLLKTPFTLTDNVNTICLPDVGESYIGDYCTGTGWGRDGNGQRTEAQNLLRKAELPVVSKDQCQNMLRKTRLGKYFRLHESFLCAGGDELDLCTGDGGGPLTCYNEKTQSEVQIGITSWGIDCGKIGVPGVYTDVMVHRDWITSTVDYLLNGYRQ